MSTRNKLLFPLPQIARVWKLNDPQAMRHICQPTPMKQELLPPEACLQGAAAACLGHG
jgi:hypothetical protein